jgi:hypothetical protein
MDSHSIYAERFRKLDRCVGEVDELIKELSSGGKLTLQDLSALLAPRESAELNIALAVCLVSLLEAQMISQGIDSSKHQLQREVQRLQSYLSKLTISNGDKTSHEENDDNS